jgi:hypothetical protein
MKDLADRIRERASIPYHTGGGQEHVGDRWVLATVADVLELVAMEIGSDSDQDTIIYLAADLRGQHCDCLRGPMTNATCPKCGRSG